MQLNKHSKLAILLAPLLIVGGYIASDQYIEHKANEQKIFALSISNKCNIFMAGCVLTSGNMQISITDNGGITKANTSFPVDSVVISLVYNNAKETIYRLDQVQNTQYWARDTGIKKAISNDLANTIRVLIKEKGRIYLSEFAIQSDGAHH